MKINHRVTMNNIKHMKAADMTRERVYELMEYLE